ncbi:MAG: glycosyltransferase family 4 protein [Acidobacteria bacterium]|nr:glycosyltransferase family 4 protein [Acidobacteriota bacterium]
MNILFVDQFGDLGGAQLCLLELIPETLRRGWKPFAVVPGQGLLAERLEALGVVVTRFAGSRTGGAPGHLIESARLASLLRELCSPERFQLLYVNGPRVLPAVALRPPGFPVLFHAHSVPNGLARKAVRWAVKRSNARTVAVSQFTANELFPGRQSAVVANGVGDLRLPRTENGVPRIGIIGRIAPEKGQLAFVEAARLLPQYRYVVCGAPWVSQDGYAERVKRGAAGLPVTFLGWREDIGAVLAGLDLLVVPSIGPEAFGRTVIEAFSAMVPVVAFPSGGIAEIIDDGRNGYLVDPQTPEALARRIDEVLADAAGRQRVADNARADWQTRYTLDRYVAGIMEQIVLAVS